jgi:hypothetical protein
VRPRPLVTTALLAALVLGAAAALYVVLFGDDDAPRRARVPTAPAAAPVAVPVAAAQPAPAGFAIAEARGTVEVRRGGAWVPVQAGDTLLPSEAIRTGDGGGAVLRTPQGDELTLRPRVELELGALDQTVGELTLTRGKVRAAPAPGRERLSIKAAGAEAQAPGGSRFTVYADARGAVTVASENGDVKVLAAGTQVTLQPSQQTTVQPGAAPGDPVPIPDEIFVSVSWPAGEVHARSATIRGRAQPGSEVMVNGREAPVGPDGTFTATIPLSTGDNPVRVTAESIDGRVKEKRGSVQADTRGPPIEADPNRLYDPPPAPGGPPKPGGAPKPGAAPAPKSAPTRAPAAPTRAPAAPR